RVVGSPSETEGPCDAARCRFMPGNGQASRAQAWQAFTGSHTPTKGETHMKRAGVWIVGIALSLAGGPLTAETGSADGDDYPKGSLATLKGRYRFGGIATLQPPASGGPANLAVAGYHIFNGDGTGKDVVSATINGQSVENQLSHPDRSEYSIT